jgi:hypothetical protein
MLAVEAVALTVHKALAVLVAVLMAAPLQMPEL